MRYSERVLVNWMLPRRLVGEWFQRRGLPHRLSYVAFGFINIGATLYVLYATSTVHFEHWLLLLGSILCMILATPIACYDIAHLLALLGATVIDTYRSGRSS